MSFAWSMYQYVHQSLCHIISKVEIPSSIKIWTQRQTDMGNPTDSIASNNQNIFVNLFLSHDTC